jgi:hypothetical protein
MPIGRRTVIRPDLYRPGSPRVAAVLSALSERLTRVAGGPGTMQTPAGPLFSHRGVGIRLGYTPSGGIPARDTNGVHGVDVTEAFLVGSAEDPYLATIQQGDSSETFAGFNLSSQDVGPQALTIYELLWGLWVCTWEDCPTSQGSS